jgi:hypothetical protein
VSVDEALTRAEDALTSRRSLRGTGFWSAVDEVKRDPALIERYADRIATIDLRAFELGVKLRVPAAVGLAALALLSAFGVWAVVVARRGCRFCDGPASNVLLERIDTSGVHIDAYGWRGFVPVAFLVGFGALLIGTHSLTHWIVGRLLGIRFTHVFLGGPPPPRPGMKTDYATYLRASSAARAWMHASGAIVTKLVPFALLPVSLSLDTGWPWLTWILLAVGVLQIVTDVFLSTKVSDWKKVKRELRIARSSG